MDFVMTQNQSEAHTTHVSKFGEDICLECGERFSQSEALDSPKITFNQESLKLFLKVELEALLNRIEEAMPKEADTADDVEMGELPHTLPDYYNKALEEVKQILQKEKNNLKETSK